MMIRARRRRPGLQTRSVTNLPANCLTPPAPGPRIGVTAGESVGGGPAAAAAAAAGAAACGVPRQPARPPARAGSGKPTRDLTGHGLAVRDPGAHTGTSRCRFDFIAMPAIPSQSRHGVTSPPSEASESESESAGTLAAAARRLGPQAVTVTSHCRSRWRRPVRPVY